ncbi:MAG: helix-turn-helix domain-containing protein, partial [Candidatus Hodarchaeota archaeon]
MNEEQSENVSQTTSEETLKSYGLDVNSINIYFDITGRGPVTVGEIKLLSGISDEEIQRILDKLLEKGLVRGIPSAVPRYEALPPYMVLLQQLSDFQDFVRNLQSGSSSSLGVQLKKVEDSIDKIKQLKDFQNSLNEVREGVPKSIDEQLKKFEDQVREFTHLEKIRSFIHETESDMTKSLEEQFSDFEQKSDVKIIKRFNDFENFMNEVKLKFMQDLQVQFGNFMGQFGRLMDSFMSLSQFIVNTSEMTPDLLRKEFKKFEDQVQDLKSKIALEFENRFKMKAFKQFIENFVEEIVIKEFNSLRESFQDDVIKVTASTFSKIEEETENISGSMITEIENLKSLFSEKIVQGVESNVSNIESQMKNISNDVKTQLSNLEEIFRNEIIFFI